MSPSRVGELNINSLAAADHPSIRSCAAASRPPALAAETPAAICARSGRNGSGCTG